jgi:glycogen synthase
VRVALVSREVYPLTGGGIGQYVAAAARLLSSVAEVTILTTSLFRTAYEGLRAANDPRLPDSAVRFAFVDEPSIEEAEAWRHVMHCYGARVYERLQELYPDGGPELIEFPDFLGEAFVTIQAAEALDRFLDRTRICVRVHTTAEICEILDGYAKRDIGSQVLHAMERFSLAHAHRLIWQGGDVLETYRRFYGAEALAAATRIRYPYHGSTVVSGADSAYEPGATLRILYAGRLERRKGVQNLIRAVTGMERGDFRLTIAGGDTETAPLGVSMRSYLELASAGDERIEFAGSLDRDAVAELIRQHDVIAIPSLWECWPYAALEPLRLNRPLLATPVGGLVELVRPGTSGWLAGATDAESLEEQLEALLENRARLAEMVRRETPLAHGSALTDPHKILDGYEELANSALGRRTSRGGPRARPPLVSAIVPYHRASAYVRDTIESLLLQTYPRVEIVLVNDGSFEEEDWIVAELAAQHPVIVLSQMNGGLGAARNFGIRQSRGRYVFPLDSDNIAEPEFVARCVEVLEARPEVAYVTSWSRYIELDGTFRAGPDLGYEPLGNVAECNAEENVAGDAAAVLRRRLFDAGFRYSEELTSFEDWHLYRELQLARHYGAVIPERLLRYRLRADSMQAEIAQPKRERLRGEIEALIRENGVQWTPSSV